jgi:germacradienol/geosmin synthase
MPISRVPSGLGTSAFFLSRSASAGPEPMFRIPPLDPPLRMGINPRLPEARRHGKEWSRQVGILAPPGEPPYLSSWTEADFDRADFAQCAAYCFPDAPPTALNLLTDYYTWVFCMDDLFGERYKKDGDLAGARKFNQRLLRFMPLDGTEPPAAENPIERGLADLWPRTTAVLSARAQRDVVRSLEEMSESWIWELHNILTGHVPDIAEYSQMRRDTAGMPWGMYLVFLGKGVEFPAALRDSPLIKVYASSFQDVGGWRNDILSYERELGEDGAPNNAVTVLRDLLDCDLQYAVDRVADVVNARLRRFRRLGAVELPAFCEELGLTAAERDQVRQCVDGLENYLDGEHRWEMASGRNQQGTGADSWPG